MVQQHVVLQLAGDRCLENTYKSLKDIEEQKAGFEASVEELTREAKRH